MQELKRKTMLTTLTKKCDYDIVLQLKNKKIKIR